MISAESGQYIVSTETKQFLHFARVERITLTSRLLPRKVNYFRPYPVAGQLPCHILGICEDNVRTALGFPLPHTMPYRCGEPVSMFIFNSPFKQPPGVVLAVLSDPH